MPLRSIVKHSYVPTSRDGLARMRAHVRYIKHRSGGDLKEGNARSFFNEKPGVVSKSAVLQAIESSSKNDQVVAHKLVMSPGVPGVHIEGYVRSVMTELGRAKGLDLTWFAVKHENTEHAHAHVIVLPRDLNGRRVRFYKTDYTKIKELGDSYLIRNRLLSRDREYEKEDKGKPAVTDFFNRLKTAIKTAFKLIRHRIIADADDGEPVAQPPRNTSRDEELLGPAPAYWQLEALRTLGDAKRKERAWRRYTKPIIVDYSDGLSGLKIATYTPKTNLLSLRRLERKFMAGDKTVTNQLSDDDFNRLRGWIREQYREDKSLERQAKAIKSIKVELSAEEDLEVSSRSSIESLKRLKKKHLKGEVNLNDAEYKALSDWLIDRQRTGET